MGKIDTAARFLASGDLGGLARAGADWVQRCLEPAAAWWRHDPALVGALVRLAGGIVFVEGCRFGVNHTQVSDAVRSRFVNGRYERSERALLRTHLDPRRPVLELGGGLGVTACIVNRRLVRPERHVVVEANPSLIPVLERHGAWNGCRFEVVHGAIDYSGAPDARLSVDDEFISGRVNGDGEVLTAPAITLSTILRRYTFDRGTLLCDIEGLEVDLIEREGEAIANAFSTLFIEVHPEFRDAEERAGMFERLRALGFREFAALRKVHAFRAASD